MKAEQDYIRDIAEIRTMMERSSKFLSLSGWAGIMAGIYALAGAFIAYKFFGLNPSEIGSGDNAGILRENLWKVMILGIIIIILAIASAVYLSYQRAKTRGEKLWNPIARQMLVHMLVPLVTGGLLILILLSKGWIGLIAPFSLIFYGLALYNGSKFTYEEVKIVGLIEIALGLVSTYFIGYGLIFWAVGFGVIHIVYGILMHYRYER